MKQKLLLDMCIIRCVHGCDVGTQLSKKEMADHIDRVHIESRRCKVLRRMDTHFKTTPRKIARGVWSNGNFSLRVVRRHDRGNTTQYAWDDERGRRFSCIVQTTSTTQLEDQHGRGRETEDGFYWYGRGYSGEKQLQLVVAKEEIMYKQVPEHHANFPVWSVLCQVYNVRGWTREGGDSEKTEGANLDVWSHPAKNPANLELATEFEITLVASAEEGGPHKMVLRRQNLPDEELTRHEELSYAQETPAADEYILRSLANHQVRQEVSKAHLPEVERTPWNEHEADTPFKFTNEGRMLCWVNAATQGLLRAGPDVATELRRVLRRPSHFSGPRDVQREMWEIATKAEEPQCLDALRDLLAPERRGQQGPALKFFNALQESLRLEGFAIEKRLFAPPRPCPFKGCDKILPSSERLLRGTYLEINHERRLDGRSAQKAVDRKFRLLEGPHPATCADGHTTSARKTVTITRRPDVFYIAARPGEGSLDQESSMQVELGGAKYEPAAVIHHVPADTAEGVGHHYCSLKDRKTGEWSLVDDYGGQGWNTPYRFDGAARALKARGRELFDDLGFVVYERAGKGEAPPRDDGVNFHRLTTSGQQALRAFNRGNECYAIAAFAMLLSNPHVHRLFRSLRASGGSELETFLRGLCHRPDHSIEPDIERLRRLVFQEHDRNGLNCTKFTEQRQQDAEEFLTKLLQAMCFKDIVDDDGFIVAEAALSKTHRLDLLETIGFTSRFRQKCTEANCTKDSYTSTEHDFVLRLPISAASVGGCIREEVGKTEAVPVLQCEICGKQNADWNRTQTNFAPKKCLILQLKRFTRDNRKINASVVVDVELAEGPFSGYRLTGAILHRGDVLENGHYTHILRDVEDGTWVTTDNDTRDVLTEKEARRRLALEGYILLYSSRDPFPPGLKAGKAVGSVAESRSTGTKEPGRSFLGNSTFQLRGARDFVSLPPTPATANLTSCQGTATPSAEEMAQKSGTPTTAGRVIDPADPLARLLRERFGHDDFRSPEQLAAVREIVAGVNDVMVIMSTGEEHFLTLWVERISAF